MSYKDIILNLDPRVRAENRPDDRAEIADGYLARRSEVKKGAIVETGIVPSSDRNSSLAGEVTEGEGAVKPVAAAENNIFGQRLREPVVIEVSARHSRSALGRYDGRIAGDRRSSRNVDSDDGPCPDLSALPDSDPLEDYGPDPNSNVVPDFDGA